MKIILYIFLLYASSINASCQTHLGMFSHHWESGDFNQDHDLLGIECDNYFLYQFNNSQNTPTVYAGFIDRHYYKISENWSAGYNVGIMSGHEKIKDGKPFVIGFPLIAYTNPAGYGFDITMGGDVVASIQGRVENDFIESAIFKPKYTGSIELFIDHADPDYRSDWGFGRNNGVGFEFEIQLYNDVFTRINYANTDFDVDPDRGSEKFTAWWKGVDSGRIYDKLEIAFISKQKSKSFDYFYGLSYNNVTASQSYINLNNNTITQVEKKRFSGLGVLAGAEYQISSKFKIVSELAIVDDLITDVRFKFGISYKPKNIEYTLRTVDYNEWRYSEYQTGLKFDF